MISLVPLIAGARIAMPFWGNFAHCGRVAIRWLTDLEACADGQLAVVVTPSARSSELAEALQ